MAARRSGATLRLAAIGLFCAGLCIVVTGCAAPELFSSPVTAAKPASVPVPPVTKAAAFQPLLSAHTEPEVLPPGLLRAALPPPLSAEQLIGMPAAQLGSLLGAPALRRREAPGEVWRYRTQACVLFVFLYRDAVAGEPRVRHVEARRRSDARPAADGDCLNSVLARRTMASR